MGVGGQGVGGGAAADTGVMTNTPIHDKHTAQAHSIECNHGTSEHCVSNL